MWPQGGQKKAQENAAGHKLSGSRTQGPTRILTVEKIHSMCLLPLSLEFHRYAQAQSSRVSM